MSKKEPSELRKLGAAPLQSEIFEYLQRHPTKKYSARQLGEKLGLSNSKDSISHALSSLAAASKIVSQKEGKFSFSKNQVTKKPRFYPKNN